MPGQQELLVKTFSQPQKKWVPKVAVADAQTAIHKEKGDSPPFLLTVRIAGNNLHNCLVDSGASGNVMPYSVCNKLRLTPTESTKKVVQLDRSEVTVIGVLNNVHIQLSSEPRIQQYIDIQVVDIPEAYGMLLSRDWSKTLNGYMSTDFYHMWLPWRGQANQIGIEREPRLKDLITEYNNTNEVQSSEAELGIYAFEVNNGVQTVPQSSDAHLTKERTIKD
jgi:hypothetical protein